MKGLSVSGIKKSFEGKTVLDGISFDLPQGEILALLGPSGCGKSTLLSLIAGLDQPDEGQVCWNEEDLAHTPTHQRGFGLMFQDYALFPHLNVSQNLAFGLNMAHWEPKRIRERVSFLLEMVGLPGFEKRDVGSLSGGEQQRVALARSLAPEPRLLMLDEPLGALDRSLREHLLSEIRRVLHAVRQTAVYVTHDQEEAFAVSDQVLLLNQGRAVQRGKAQEIYNHPATPFVARFLGMDNLYPAEVTRDGDHSVLECALGKFPLARPASSRQGILLLRPDSVSLDPHGRFSLETTLRENVFLGTQQKTVLEANSVLLKVDFPQNADLPPLGNKLKIHFDPLKALQFFPQGPEAGEASTEPLFA